MSLLELTIFIYKCSNLYQKHLHPSVRNDASKLNIYWKCLFTHIIILNEGVQENEAFNYVSSEFLCLGNLLI